MRSDNMTITSLPVLADRQIGDNDRALRDSHEQVATRFMDAVIVIMQCGIKGRN